MAGNPDPRLLGFMWRIPDGYGGGEVEVNQHAMYDRPAQGGGDPSMRPEDIVQMLLAGLQAAAVGSAPPEGDPVTFLDPTSRTRGATQSAWLVPGNGPGGWGVHVMVRAPGRTGRVCVTYDKAYASKQDQDRRVRAPVRAQQRLGFARHAVPAAAVPLVALIRVT